MNLFDVTIILGIALYMNGTDENLRATGERLATQVDASGATCLAMLRKTENPKAFVAASLVTIDVYLDELEQQA